MRQIVLLSLVCLSLVVNAQKSSVCDDVAKSKMIDPANGAVRYSTDLINVENNGLKLVPFTFLKFVTAAEPKYSIFLMIKDLTAAKPSEKGVVINFEGGFKIALSDQPLIADKNVYVHSVGIQLNAMQINIFKTKSIISFSLANHVQSKIDEVWAEKTRQQFVCMTAVIKNVKD